ncbi:MAG: M1 family metallopeptidase [Bacteroidia bacterium]|nr:M1 family metallopeptidase [Bacteroidia bacterium]
MKLHIKITYFFCGFILHVFSQSTSFTKDDTLLGSNHVYRAWVDMLNYDITVKPDVINKTITGCNTMRYKVLSDSLPFILQLDLQEPMQIDSIFLDGKLFLNFKKEKNRWMLTFPKQDNKSVHYLSTYFSGMPHHAINPPWDGGWVWKKDSLGRPWASVACQGIGASVWFPCKDIQCDEATASLHIILPDSLVGIGNGKLQKHQQDGLTSYDWTVENLINNYNVVPYIGNYILVHDSVQGENGKLMTDYWVLDYHKNKVESHLKPNVTKTLKCFEYWFGPYPFYNDSYKIVEAPYLGMEHQSNVAYGNYFLNGYAGRDLSNTGWGLKWDFIVVHESGHEWFGNSVTAKDVADNWIHEGFTSYSEVLFTECEFGKEAGSDYCIGVRKSILNDSPIIGNYGVKNEGSGDMYYKGSQIVNMIRHFLNDDEKFRSLLRAINQTYYHQTVSSAELEEFISKFTNINLAPFFNQYLRTTQIPQLEYKITKNKIEFRFSNCIKDFTMPLKISADKERIITPTTQWQTLMLNTPIKQLKVDRNMYIDVKN